MCLIGKPTDVRGCESHAGIGNAARPAAKRTASVSRTTDPVGTFSMPGISPPRALT